MKKTTENTVKRNVHLLIDADSICFKAAHMSSKETEAVHTKTNKLGFAENHVGEINQDPIAVFDSMLSGIVDFCAVNLALKGVKVTGFSTYYTANTRYDVCRGMKKNFRMFVWAGYKGCRKGRPIPKALEDVFNHAVMLEHAIICQGKEADDVVAYEKNNNPDGTVLVAIDKDLLYGVAGEHFDFGKFEECITTKEEAIRYPYIQCIEGDSSDCYKGVRGIGKVGARKIITNILTDEVEMWRLVLEAYTEAGQTEEDALVTMRLADMNQWNGEDIILWQPKAVLS